MKDLERVKIIKIKNDSFSFDIADVSVQHFVAIEAEKQRLSNDAYKHIATTYFQDSLNAASLIEMIATFRVLEPKIEESVATKNFEKLSILDIRELLSVYIKNLAPWWRLWMKEFNSPFEDEEINGDEVDLDEK